MPVRCVEMYLGFALIDNAAVARREIHDRIDLDSRRRSRQIRLIAVSGPHRVWRCRYSLSASLRKVAPKIWLAFPTSAVPFMTAVVSVKVPVTPMPTGGGPRDKGVSVGGGGG